MPQLNDNGIKFNAPLEMTKNDMQILLKTDNKYVDKDILLEVQAREINPEMAGGEFTDYHAGFNYNNLECSSVDTSGIEIIPEGWAERGPIYVKNPYEGWFSQTGDIVIASSTNLKWEGHSQYITGVTLQPGKSFNITVPNGDGPMITFHFDVAENGEVTIT